jgi:hypothetical protein
MTGYCGMQSYRMLKVTLGPGILYVLFIVHYRTNLIK